MVLAAMVPLALGVAADFYVVLGQGGGCAQSGGRARRRQPGRLLRLVVRSHVCAAYARPRVAQRA